MVWIEVSAISAARYNAAMLRNPPTSHATSFSRLRAALALSAATAIAALAACGSSTSSPESPESPAPAPAAAPEEPAPAPAGPREVSAVEVSAEIRAAIDAADRTPEDRALDAGRKPGELVAFAGIRPGMKVAEIAAAGGYTTEILARAVGPTGAVYAENSKGINQFVGKAWPDRLARPALKNVVRVDRELDDPLPPEAKELDSVFMVLFYHDLVWIKTDRDRLNAAVFAALKPGGTYIIVDHSGRDGTGMNEVQTLHRIEESAVRAEIEKAGFRLVETATFLRNPSDARDWNASPRAAADKRGTSDRFVLKFEKPAN
jgi:predicted methyltransferase